MGWARYTEVNTEIMIERMEAKKRKNKDYPPEPIGGRRVVYYQDRNERGYRYVSKASGCVGTGYKGNCILL